MTSNGSVIVRALARLDRGGRAPALVDGAGPVSWDRLRALVAALRAELFACGVGPGDRVAVLAPRGRDETAALLAVWSVAASAVPLDAASPDLRNRRILDGADVRVLVGASVAASRLGRIAADPGACAPDAARGGVVPDEPPASDEAIVLHTSGSSGTPKGVPVTHAGATAFVDWMTGEFDVRPGDAVAALASPTFDLALFEQLAPLAAGGTILRPDERASLSARGLATFLHAGGVSCIYAVPSLYVRLLAAGSLPPFAALRTVLFAGETFPPAPLRELRAALPGRTFANLFGPTETNVTVFHRLADDEPRAAEPLPIGRACPYAEVELVPEDLGAGGDATYELVARGPTVLARYVGAEPPPVQTVRVPGRGDAPFLRTGDRVARGADGLLRFRGRRDALMKVRGFRVEPDEVECALTSCPGVADAVVRRVEHPALGEILAADVAAFPGDALSVAAVRAHAAARLPAYMVPTEMRLVADVARSDRGKRTR